MRLGVMRRVGLAAVCGLSILAAVPVQGQTLRVALREDPDILDPTLARSYVGRIAFAGLCDKLFDIDEKLQIVPQLALGYEWSDPTTLVIRLRPNVTFHDGEPFDAAAVKYGLERHLSLQGSFRRAEISVIDHVEAVDPLTVRVVLKSPAAPLLAILTDRSGMIVAPKAAEAAGKDFGLHPVCNGPFKFTERVAQDRIVLDRYAGYWDAANVHFDRVIYQPMPDSAVLVANLHTGNIDLAERVLPTDVAEVKRDAKLKIVTSPALGYEGITFNLGNGDRSKAAISRECAAAAGVRCRARSPGAGRCGVQQHVSADRAGGAAVLAVLCARDGASGTRHRACGGAGQAIGCGDADRGQHERSEYAGPHAAGGGHPVDGARRRV